MTYSKKRPRNVDVELANYQSQFNDPLALTSQYVTSISLEDEFQGEQLPGWHLRLRHHLPSTTIASGTRKEVKLGRSYFYTKVRRESDGQISQRLSTGHFEFEKCIATSPPPDADSIRLTVSNNALSQFLRRAKAKQRQFQSGVFFGEIRQTLNLLRSPLKVVRSGLDHYVRTCRANYSVKKGSRFLANQWLQYQFGIKPFISDIESIVGSLVRYQHKRASVKTGFQASAEVPRSYETEFVPSYCNLASSLRHTSKKWVCTRRIVGEVYVEPDGPIAVQQSWGLGTRDFLPTIYELIPYSFVVDYFVNIGEIIDAWSFNQADLAWHNDTLREELVTECHIDPHVDPSGAGLTLLDSLVSAPKSTYKITTFVRRSDPLGLPVLAFRLPGLGVKFLNLAALARLRVL